MVAIGVLALAGLVTVEPATKLTGRVWEPTPGMVASATGASGDVVWLEEQMCFCEVPHLPPVNDTYRTPFGLARRIHGDFRGRAVNSVEGAL